MQQPEPRKSVPLTADDAADVATLRVDLFWQQAAQEVAGVRLSESPSEAEALQALVAVGRRVLADRVAEQRMETGYAELAATQVDEDRALARATGRRTARLGD